MPDRESVRFTGMAEHGTVDMTGIAGIASTTGRVTIVETDGC